MNLDLQLTSKENKQVLEDKTRLTKHFIATLPQLLLKVGQDCQITDRHCQITVKWLTDTVK